MDLPRLNGRHCYLVGLLLTLIPDSGSQLVITGGFAYLPHPIGRGKILRMLKTRFEWAVLWVVAALLGGGWLVMSREEVSEPRFSLMTEAPIVGHLAPDFELETAVTHIPHSLSQYSGQPIVLNFWATWCSPCRIEMPHLQTASEQFAGEVVFLGINQNEAEAQVADFVGEYGIEYPILLDDGLAVNIEYQVHSLPTTIFINADGMVDGVIIGTINRAIIEDRIEQMLDNQLSVSSN